MSAEAATGYAAAFSPFDEAPPHEVASNFLEVTCVPRCNHP